MLYFHSCLQQATVAQAVERVIGNDEVSSSNLLSSFIPEIFIFIRFSGFFFIGYSAVYFKIEPSADLICGSS